MNGPEVIFKAVMPMAEEAARIFSERSGECEFGGVCPGDKLEITFAEEDEPGYILEIKGGKVTISAGMTREFIAAAGRLLTMLRKAADSPDRRLADAKIVDVPKHPERVHYMPSHFGNSFEVAWPGEMQRYLEDMALSGASGYGEWFDPNDMPDPYDPIVYCSTSISLWDKKKEFLRIAKRLGLDIILTVTHNVGFTNQMRPEWMGKRDHTKRVQGQVLCPSNPDARAVCMKNHDNLFKDLVKSGVTVDRLLMTPYDDGGCACDKCQPYYPVFLGMVRDIQSLAASYYPGVKVDMCGWWASDDEMRQLREFIGGVAAKWFHSFQYSATYGVFAIPEDIRDIVGPMTLSSFMHIGFSHDDRDCYNVNGIHSAAARIKSIIGSFEKVGCIGFCSYNEMFGDHFNMYVSGLLGRDPSMDVRELAQDYCRQMFGLKGQDLLEMADLLLDMEMLEDAKAEKWAEKLKELSPRVKSPAIQKWAFDQVILKAELMALDHRIGTGKEWQSREDVEPVLPLIRERLELSEKLWREVYGFGVLRHIFIPARVLPGWYAHYSKIYPVRTGNMKPGAEISKDA